MPSIRPHIFNIFRINILDIDRRHFLHSHLPTRQAAQHVFHIVHYLPINTIPLQYWTGDPEPSEPIELQSFERLESAAAHGCRLFTYFIAIMQPREDQFSVVDRRQYFRGGIVYLSYIKHNEIGASGGWSLSSKIFRPWVIICQISPIPEPWCTFL